MVNFKENYPFFKVPEGVQLLPGVCVGGGGVSNFFQGGAQQLLNPYRIPI